MTFFRNRRRPLLSIFAGFLSLHRERLSQCTGPSSILSLAGKTAAWATEVASGALSNKLMDGVTFENAEETEIVDSTKILYHQV